MAYAGSRWRLTGWASGICVLAALIATTPLAGAAPAALPEGVAPVAFVGEALPEATVTAFEEHREYHRYHLTLADRRVLVVEVLSSGSHPGVCQRDGLTLFPRWELLGEVIPAGPQHPAVETLCARLGLSPAAPFSPAPSRSLHRGGLALVVLVTTLFAVRRLFRKTDRAALE